MNLVNQTRAVHTVDGGAEVEGPWRDSAMDALVDLQTAADANEGAEVVGRLEERWLDIATYSAGL